MNKITLPRAGFDALPIHRLPPGREVAQRWKLESMGKWWYAEYVDTGGFVEIVISEIVVVDKAEPAGGG